jgi:ribonuclease J
MKLIIHRGAHQVGGSCVELSHMDSTILLDVGLPLDSCFDDNPELNLPQPLFDEIRQGIKKIHAVILSHAHMDHYGLAGMLPTDMPIYCGPASADLMELTSRINPRKMQSFKPQFFKDRKTFIIGSFSITPYLVDHSAFDAYGFLITAGGKSLFYTGDFRAHGRKAKIFDKLINDLPKINVLVMEGTMIGPRSDEFSLTEKELEERFVQLIQDSPGIVMVSASSQNIDRLVTLFRATVRSQRLFIIDFYTAEVLEKLGKYANVPQASWPKIRVCYPKPLARRFEMLGLNDILKRHIQNGVRWTRIHEIEDKVVMLMRPGFLFNIKKFLSLRGATWIYSMWPGYFKKGNPLNEMRAYFEAKGVRIEYLHTGGHAKKEDLVKMANTINPSMLIPIHSFHSEKFKDIFNNVRLVKDGEVLQID